MVSLLFAVGFFILSARFVYWIGLSLEKTETYAFRVFLAQFVEGLLLFFFFLQFFGGKDVFLFPKNLAVQVVGFFLVLGGVLLAYFSKKQLGNGWINAGSYQKQKGNLITSGPYAFVRHPLYTGIIASYVGAELLAGSWLFLSLLFFYIPFYFQAKKEEKFLLQRFGNTYKKYIRSTRMFVPFLW